MADSADERNLLSSISDDGKQLHESERVVDNLKPGPADEKTTHTGY